ncbi:MAG: hypothetical protein ACTSU5_08595 [Promethearchaeota archaeon]
MSEEEKTKTVEQENGPAGEGEPRRDASSGSAAPESGPRAAEGTPLAAEPPKTADKKVILHAEAYKSIILFAARYANASIPREEWKEIYGVLTGYIDRDADTVVVEKAIALTSGESTDVHLEARHYAQIAEVENQLFSEGKGRFMVGWFHSHPGLTIFYSYVDIMNHLAFQTANPDFIGLVFDHTALGEAGHHGFKIFKLTDVNMDMGDPNFENNYHEVPYEIEGIDEFFFANVLAELSARYAAKSPLQMSYEEEKGVATPAAPGGGAGNQPAIGGASPIPLHGTAPAGAIPLADAAPRGANPLPIRAPGGPAAPVPPKSGTIPLPVKVHVPVRRTPGEAAVFEARKAHRLKDSFTAIEKYQEAIKYYQDEGEVEKALDLMKEFAETTLQSDHLGFSEDWATRLRDYAEKEGDMYALASAHLILGQVSLKKASSAEGGEQDEVDALINTGLENLEEAAKGFDVVKDFAGAGLCYNQIADVQYYTIKDYSSAALFYLEAMKNYLRATRETPHPKRASIWAKPENLRKKIRGLRVFITNLLETRVDGTQERDKIRGELEKLG